LCQRVVALVDQLDVGSLPETGIDDFQAGIAEKCGYQAAATTMSIKANFFDKGLNGTSNLLFCHLDVISGSSVVAFTAA
jgi:hypothetical protein